MARLSDTDAVLLPGHRGYVGVPLTAREGAVHGVLSVYSREPRAWRDEEVQALVALAANASVALWNAELYQRVAVEREQSVAILANIADGIVALDREGRVVLWNRAAAEITGVPAEEALGADSGAGAAARPRVRERAARTGSSRSRATAQDVWLSLSEAVMRDPSGAVAGRIFAFRDISAEHAVETMKSDFVSTVSVELRTPLTSIYGFAQTLLREDVAFGEPERRTFLEFIARESERLTTIVDALLSVARLDAGGRDVSTSRDGCRRCRGLGRDAATSSVNGSGHEFVADIEGGSLAAQADPEKLRQVLEQLVSNAVKFSPEGGTVTIAARRVGKHGRARRHRRRASASPPFERERIFSKFYRGVDAQGPGAGLGLFIAQGLVREMGGRMWVDATEARGSRFTFELPLAGERVSFSSLET